MKNSGFVTRTISGAVLVIILLAVGYFGGYPLLAFSAFVGIVGLNELYKALSLIDKKAEDKKKNLLGKIGILGTVLYFIVLSVAMFFLFAQKVNEYIKAAMQSTDIFGSLDFVTEINKEVRQGYLIIALVFIVVMFVLFAGLYVFTFPRYNIEQVSYALFGIIYVPVFMTFVYLIRSFDNGVWVFWLIFISSWVCDTCAYLVGCTMGKHRLAPVLSPKKSIEGSVGGIAGAILVAFIFGYVQTNITGAESHVTQYMIICGVGSVVSQIGDLCASAIKRNKEIKDYGKLIPGHGGILDRFDSVIFVAPVIYFMALVLL